MKNVKITIYMYANKVGIKVAAELLFLLTIFVKKTIIPEIPFIFCDNRFSKFCTF